MRIPIPQEIKEAPDPELAIPTSSVPNYQTVIAKPVTKPTEIKKTYRGKGKYFSTSVGLKYL